MVICISNKIFCQLSFIVYTTNFSPNVVKRSVTDKMHRRNGAKRNDVAEDEGFSLAPPKAAKRVCV
jgi:hypothetical protein